MAHFMANIRGRRGPGASRLGDKSSGMTTHIRGWDVGVRVEARYENGKDVFRIYRTGGSNMSSNLELIAEVDKVVSE